MNELKHRDEFETILADYQLSDDAKQTLKNTRFVSLVGPSSSGRNTIVNELLESDHYHLIVSDTTRQPRMNNGILEQNGREYWFRTEEDFLADLRAGEFLEAAIIHNQQVSGISIREFEAASHEGKIAINEMEVVGAATIHKMKPDATFFFVIPPSFDEWMVRMSMRGSLPETEIRRRMESARKEIKMALEADFYVFVVNTTFMHAARAIDKMVTTGTYDTELQIKNRAIAQELLDDTIEHLTRL